MVDVFGGSRRFRGGRGPRGPIGPKGAAGSIVDLCTWMPKTVLENLQRNDEQGCFSIQNPDKDLQRKGAEITVWISHNATGSNLVAEKPSNKLEKLEEPDDRYVINFENTRYIAEDLTLFADPPSSYGLLCITFRVTSDAEQVLISDYENDKRTYCEIKVATNEILIHAHSIHEVIQHSCKDWTTLFIEHSSDETTTHYNYKINGLTGSFTSPADTDASNGFALGSRYDDTYFLKRTGCIAGDISN